MPGAIDCRSLTVVSEHGSPPSYCVTTFTTWLFLQYRYLSIIYFFATFSPRPFHELRVSVFSNVRGLSKLTLVRNATIFSFGTSNTPLISFFFFYAAHYSSLL